MFFQLCIFFPNFSQRSRHQVEEKLESGQGKTSFRRFFSRFCTPIFLEVLLSVVPIPSFCFGHSLSQSFNKLKILYCELKYTTLTITSDNSMFHSLQSFILTFLAEWGDRSQIATIAVREHITHNFFHPICLSIFNSTEVFLTLQLATHKNAIGVAIGATIGHTICTSVAVVGGSMLASKISQGTVATIGGLLFLGFSLSSYFYPPL